MFILYLCIGLYQTMIKVRIGNSVVDCRTIACPLLMTMLNSSVGYDVDDEGNITMPGSDVFTEQDLLDYVRFCNTGSIPAHTCTVKSSVQPPTGFTPMYIIPFNSSIVRIEVPEFLTVNHINADLFRYMGHTVYDNLDYTRICLMHLWDDSNSDYMNGLVVQECTSQRIREPGVMSLLLDGLDYSCIDSMEEYICDFAVHNVDDMKTFFDRMLNTYPSIFKRNSNYIPSSSLVEYLESIGRMDVLDKNIIDMITDLKVLGVKDEDILGCNRIECSVINSPIKYNVTFIRSPSKFVQSITISNYSHILNYKGNNYKHLIIDYLIIDSNILSYTTNVFENSVKYEITNKGVVFQLTEPVVDISNYEHESQCYGVDDLDPDNIIIIFLSQEFTYKHSVSIDGFKSLIYTHDLVKILSSRPVGTKFLLHKYY